MEIGKTLYLTDRKDWRDWLTKNYSHANEIWLILYKKDSGKPRLPYDDAVEEALCYGWIDSIVKKYNKEATCQRFTPRKKNSVLSQLNKERIKKLIAEDKMTSAGMESIKKHLDEDGNLKEYILPDDILNILRNNELAWKNFSNFPDSYKRVRIALIDESRKQPDVFNQRLNYFIKMTEKNKKYGTLL